MTHKIRWKKAVPTPAPWLFDNNVPTMSQLCRSYILGPVTFPANRILSFVVPSDESVSKISL